MRIYGYLAAKSGDRIFVEIVTRHSILQQLEIGDGESGLWFAAEDAVEVTGECNDTFDVLLPQSCTIRLQSDRFIGDFYCTSCRDAYVRVQRNGVNVFCGYLEPLSYNQVFQDSADDVELHCVDALSALRYTNYKGVGTPGVVYDEVRNAAEQRTFADIISELFGTLDYSDTFNLWYDCSKAINNATARQYTLFSDLSISDLLFLGGSEDDVWPMDEVLTEILRYLNLHITQVGNDFFIFSWESVRAGTPIYWREITNGNLKVTDSPSVAISNANVADCDTQLTISDVYNRLSLTCSTTNVDSVVESPLDDAQLTSPYTNRQLYITEYSSDGEGDRAIDGFWDILNGEVARWDETATTDWYLQVMQSKSWRFPYKPNNVGDIYAEMCVNNEDQQRLPNWLRSHQGAAILSLGSIETKGDGSDNAVISKVDMTNYLVVSVNGSDDESNPYPTQADLLASMPRAVYKGNVSGGVFSPSDEVTTNYIVISGNLSLNPLNWQTDNYPSMAAKMREGKTAWKLAYWHRTVPSRNNGDGRYYTREYFRAVTPKSEEVKDLDTPWGFCPLTGKGPQNYEFNYSTRGDSSDKISKVPVLQCMLIIGDKCAVEQTESGAIGDIIWQTYKERSQCSSDEEYYAQSFSIGFDPKIGDKILGSEFNIQNNISYKMGVDASGTAIPIRKSDHLSGRVQFMILGPVNAYWGDVVRHHHNFWHGGSWSDSNVPLLVHTENILIKEFEIKVYSDNGMVNNTDDSDILYMSDTAEDFVNIKDDLEMKISSALTTDECVALGVTNAIKLSTPLNVQSGDGVVTLYNKNKEEQVKPEQDYVDSYYTEYSAPRIMLEQTLLGVSSSPWGVYTHPALSGKRFFVQSRSLNLQEGETRFTLKEIES